MEEFGSFDGNRDVHDRTSSAGLATYMEEVNEIWLMQHQQTQESLNRSTFQLTHRLHPCDDVTAAALVHNIASFLTFSDAASLTSMEPSAPARVQYDDDEASEVTPADSWAFGVEFDGGSSWSIDTPPTPAVVAISPGATPDITEDLDGDVKISLKGARMVDGYAEDKDIERLDDVLRERRRRWAQEKITAAVFAHPKPLRSYCVEAFTAAMNIRQQKEQVTFIEKTDPETLREPCISIRKRKRPHHERGLQIIHELIDALFQNIPLSVVLDMMEGMGVLSLEVSLASFQLTLSSLNKIVSALGRTIQNVFRVINSFNPLRLLEAIISLQFNAMGKTSEVLASGIQSVATGVGSASSMALYRFSNASNSASRLDSSSSLAGNVSLSRSRSSSNDVFKKKLLRKLSVINDAALVVAYREMEDDTGGLTRKAVTRTRRMMHYTVPLRPFVATVAISPYHDSFGNNDSERSKSSVNDSSDNFSELFRVDSSSSGEDSDSPFMCTPQSFPPTPHSRQMVIAQRSQFSDDVIFIARDRLRVHDGLKSEDERTRERSRVLDHEKQLAVFACKDPASGIELTCGRHIATKVGHMYYASARSMIPALRNCFVYFELTVLPQIVTGAVHPSSVVTLSFGLSTEEMPPNTLVGAWQGSVGLCTTGQILMAGQWCSPADPVKSSYGADSTVGCLVYLDDESAFETWDGVMVKAIIRFNVNGVMVSQPVSTLPMSGSPAAQPPLSSIPTAVTEFREQSGINITALGSTSSATLTLLVPASEDLYPTVTLQSAGTSVVCRFSTEDIAANSRLSIGAPEGVVVYAIDGSVILHANE